MKLLVICGLTASGKTSLALKIAKKIAPASIISADSRQAYQGLSILSGQDIPPGFTQHQDKICKYRKLPGIYYSKGSINIWGIDQVPPTETLNISDFTKFVWKVIKKESRAGKKIIIVGGTGLYLKALTQPLVGIHMGYKPKFRKALNNFSLIQLQRKLQDLSQDKYNNLNSSDRFNPRRLIRAIEILANPSVKKPAYLKLQKNATFHWIGLKPDLNTLEKNIKTRVLTRLKNNAIAEVKTLNKNRVSSTPIYSALGLSHILSYQKKEINKDELIRSWVRADLKYAKRQITWFKKQPKIVWYNLSNNQNKLVNSLSLWLN